MRKPYLAANWKMNKTVAETEEFFSDLLGNLPEVDADVVVCPPFTALGAAVAACEGSRVRIAAQNMHEADGGAFTGEVSAAMLTEAGVSGVVLGHSERRQYFNETDEALARKVVVALDAGLEPILCVGESEAERDGDETEAVLKRQIEADLADVDDQRLGAVVIAYEPIWAIGTGKTASTGQAQEACELIRHLVSERNPGAGEAVRILYGGSMKPGNAAELISQPDVDGGLIGGASLDPADFAAIIEAAGE